jgi:hypothetical protein
MSGRRIIVEQHPDTAWDDFIIANFVGEPIDDIINDTPEPIPPRPAVPRPTTPTWRETFSAIKQFLRHIKHDAEDFVHTIKRQRLVRMIINDIRHRDAAGWKRFGIGLAGWIAAVIMVGYFFHTVTVTTTNAMPLILAAIMGTVIALSGAIFYLARRL